MTINKTAPTEWQIATIARELRGIKALLVQKNICAVAHSLKLNFKKTLVLNDRER